MRRRLVFPLALGLLVAFPVLAQRGEERGQNRPRANQSRVPPPPPRRDNPRSQPEPERHDSRRVNSSPACQQGPLVRPRPAGRQALSLRPSFRARSLRAFWPVLPLPHRTLRSRSAPLVATRRVLL